MVITVAAIKYGISLPVWYKLRSTRRSRCEIATSIRAASSSHVKFLLPSLSSIRKNSDVRYSRSFMNWITFSIGVTRFSVDDTTPPTNGCDWEPRVRPSNGCRYRQRTQKIWRSSVQRVVPEICVWKDRQTHRQTCSSQYSAPLQWWIKEPVVWRNIPPLSSFFCPFSALPSLTFTATSWSH